MNKIDTSQDSFNPQTSFKSAMKTSTRFKS